LFRHVADPKRAVAEFRALAERHPDASCAHWNLGVKSEMVGDFERAARAYRRYLQLVPNTRRRDAVERRIENLEARLR
jgi:Flp pilus assembly protein TadD